MSGGRQRQIPASSSLANFELILRSQGAFPLGFYLPRVGWVYCPTPGAPQKGNADGTEGMFGTCRMRVGYGPAPGPTIKRPCAILARSVGRATNTASSSLALCPVVGRPRPAVVASRTVRSGVFHHWIHHLWPQGAVPPGFNPLRRGWVYRPAPEAPRKRNADGIRGIFGTACRVGLRPCDRTHLKNGLVPYSYAGGS